MALVMFDLDETLVEGDCSSRWVHYMVAQGLVAGEVILAEEASLMADYYNGGLDMQAYMDMLLRPLIGMPETELTARVAAYVADYIRPHIRDAARAQVNEVIQRGDRPLIISASAEFLIRPIARELGIEEVLGVQVETDAQGCITGAVAGVMTYQQGKVIRLNDWLQQQQENLIGSAFYTDSHNDLPLLEVVEFPVAVTPDAQLNQLAQARGWPVLNW